MHKCRQSHIDSRRVYADSVRKIPSSPVRQHTPNHVDCPLCETARQLLIDPGRFVELSFAQAFPLWLDSRMRLAPRTRADYESYFKVLEPFFGGLPLKGIHIGHI